MTMRESRKELEQLKSDFEAKHTIIAEKITAAQAERDFKLVIVLLNEERELVKQNSEKMLKLMAEARS